MNALTHVRATPAPDAAILALAQQVVEILQRDASKTEWFEPLDLLTDMQARSLEGLLAKAQVWQFAADLDIDACDDLAFADLHDSVVSDLLNWEVV
jgi:hypothetical protein